MMDRRHEATEGWISFCRVSLVQSQSEKGSKLNILLS